MDGLFSMELLASPVVQSLVPRCGACGLYKGCNSPKMEVVGDGERGILILGEAPGEQEDAEGAAFVGRSGRLLRQVLQTASVDMLRDCRLTNALICRPSKNRPPKDKELEYCSANLTKIIRAFKPMVIIPVGVVAVKALVRVQGLWSDSVGPMARWAGWQIPCQQYNAWICPTYHPDYILRVGGEGKRSSLPVIFKRQLKRAVEREARPWKKAPDYRSKIETVLDARRAAQIIRDMIRRGGSVAFDYETNMLKPDSARARIVAASVCWNGRRTIAYPWVGEAIEATSELLKSPLPKIGANKKFEQRWSIAVLGHGVTNWCWDVVDDGHVLDNRSWASGLKFQSFVHLGQSTYDNHIKPFLKATGGNEENRVRDVSREELLLYCGLDSLLTFLVAKKQMRLMGMEGFLREIQYGES